MDWKQIVRDPKILAPDGSPILQQEEIGENRMLSMEQAKPRRLFLLPHTSSSLFPGIVAPFVLHNDTAKRTIMEVERLGRPIGLVPTRNEDPETIKKSDLYEVGVVGWLARRINLPDDGINAVINILGRIRIDRIVRFSPLIVAEVSYPEDQLHENDIEVKALMRSLLNGMKRISKENPFITEEIKLVMANLNHPAQLADVVASVMQLDIEEYVEVLGHYDVKRRLQRVLDFLTREMEMADVQRKIQSAISDRVSKSQREYLLREQIKEINKELGGEEGAGEVGLLEKKIQEANMPPAALKAAKEELEKIANLHESSPEYAVSRSYLDWLCSLPWSKSTPENLDLAEAQRVLENDHYGLEEVKERIIEYLAVRKIKEKPEGSILCLVGPPGVGKTSLGRSIAKAMGRKFIRFSLGGMRDEAEIKGHRRTYLGALPGKIIQEIKRSETNNPVFMLDEIDKLGVSFQGDPSSALLEALDPEQNSAFLDHYIDTPFDLSKVFFVTTANTLDTIPGPLLDRMEVIRLSGYILEEKIAIGRKYIVPRQREKHGLKPSNITITREAIRAIIEDYTLEAGLRNFEREIEKICRKTATRLAKGNSQPTRVDRGDIKDYLGKPRHFPEMAGMIAKPGVVTGLAWTPVGGVILFIEAISLPEKEGTLRLTGSMGQVMNESANIALSYTKSIAGRFGAPTDWFVGKGVHIHLPSGATPKDGPSAGLAMAVSLLSLITGRQIDSKIAMTGELTLTGKVLPVGGIKEKVIAARRAGIARVILPKPNARDLEEIPAYIKKKLKFDLVDDAEEVFGLLWPNPANAASAKSQRRARAPKSHPPRPAAPPAPKPTPRAPRRPPIPSR